MFSLCRLRLPNIYHRWTIPCGIHSRKRFENNIDSKRTISLSLYRECAITAKSDVHRDQPFMQMSTFVTTNFHYQNHILNLCSWWGLMQQILRFLSMCRKRRKEWILPFFSEKYVGENSISAYCTILNCIDQDIFSNFFEKDVTRLTLSCCSKENNRKWMNNISFWNCVI